METVYLISAKNAKPGLHDITKQKLVKQGIKVLEWDADNDVNADNISKSKAFIMIPSNSDNIPISVLDLESKFELKFIGKGLYTNACEYKRKFDEYAKNLFIYDDVNLTELYDIEDIEYDETVELALDALNLEDGVYNWADRYAFATPLFHHIHDEINQIFIFLCQVLSLTNVNTSVKSKHLTKQIEINSKRLLLI